MPVELKILALGALLLFVHIFAATRFKTAQYGRKWNVGARDEDACRAEPDEPAGRCARRPISWRPSRSRSSRCSGVVIAGRTSQWTALGGWIWLGARVVYLPLYAAGVPVIRTVDLVDRHDRPGDGDLAVAVRLTTPSA